jgi:N-acetylglucosaminyl-diphospho-decaprenol L-rhamnosyltransferase
MISIVIVNWNSGRHLGNCLASLAAHAPDAETVVVDNASADGSLDAALPRAPSAVAVRNSQNRGFAAACNQGWATSAGDPVLFLNPDAESTSGSVQRLACTLEEDAAAWAAGGRLTDCSGSTQIGFNVRRFPTPSQVAAEAFLLHRLWPRNPWTRRYRLLDWPHDARSTVDQPAGACLMVRRSALKQIGGFDESFYPAWFEDVDLCRRIYDLGGTVVFEPRACFIHYGGASLERLEPAEFLYAFHRNQARYFRKHHGVDAARRVETLAVAGIRLRAVLSVFRPRTAAAYWKAARKIRAEGAFGI